MSITSSPREDFHSTYHGGVIITLTSFIAETGKVRLNKVHTLGYKQHSAYWKKGFVCMDYDGDGLTDDAELYTWGINPYDMDNDNDERSDYEEVVTYETNPNNPNTHGDAINDGTEIAWNYDPLDSSSPIQASSLIQSMQIYSGSIMSVTASSLTGVTKVKFYAQYKDYLGTWTSYQLIGTDSSAPFVKSWVIPAGYVAIRVKGEAYNSGNIYLGCDTAYMTLGGGGGGGGEPVPY